MLFHFSSKLLNDLLVFQSETTMEYDVTINPLNREIIMEMKNNKKKEKTTSSTTTKQKYYFLDERRVCKYHRHFYL